MINLGYSVGHIATTAAFSSVCREPDSFLVALFQLPLELRSFGVWRRYQLFWAKDSQTSKSCVRPLWKSVSTKNRDLCPLLPPTSGQVQHRSPRFTDFQSDWLWSQSTVFRKPFKTGMSLDLARGPQRSNECARDRARVGLDCTISIETSKRQNGGRFKFREDKAKTKQLRFLP